MGALIQTDHHIRPEGKLKLYGFFRGELNFAFAALRVKDEPVFIHFPEGFIFPDQGKGLKTAGVRDDGMLPPAHAVHAAERLHYQTARLLHQVEGVHHQPFHAGAFKVQSVCSADHAVSRIRQVDRIQQLTVGGFQPGDQIRLTHGIEIVKPTGRLSPSTSWFFTAISSGRTSP